MGDLLVKRPLPDTEEYERQVRRKKLRQLSRIALLALLLPAIAAAVYLLAGGQLPEPLDALLHATSGPRE